MKKVPKSISDDKVSPSKSASRTVSSCDTSPTTDPMIFMNWSASSSTAFEFLSRKKRERNKAINWMHAAHNLNEISQWKVTPKCKARALFDLILGWCKIIKTLRTLMISFGFKPSLKEREYLHHGWPKGETKLAADSVALMSKDYCKICM